MAVLESLDHSRHAMIFQSLLGPETRLQACTELQSLPHQVCSSHALISAK